MAAAKKGDNVKVHYKGTLQDGSVFDTSEGREPLEFTLGEGQLLPLFEAGVMGLEVGEKKEIHIPAADGYGLRRDDLIASIPLTQFPDDLTPEIGLKLQLQTPQDHPLVVTIIAIEDGHVTVDGNHELADQDLNFAIELVENAS